MNKKITAFLAFMVTSLFSFATISALSAMEGVNSQLQAHPERRARP